MISINLSSIQKLGSVILRQIRPRVSNFGGNRAALPHRNLARAEHFIESSMKSATLTLDVSVQCFKHTGKHGWVSREICPLQLML
jgi:hypothetical protein